MISFFKQYLPSILVCTAVLILSTVNTGVLPRVDAPNSDKWVHAIMYFGVVMSLLMDSSHYLSVFITKSKAFYSFLFAVAFGALMECIQGMLPWRSASLLDILANTLGAFLGLAVFFLFRRLH